MIVKLLEINEVEGGIIGLIKGVEVSYLLKECYVILLYIIIKLLIKWKYIIWYMFFLVWFFVEWNKEIFYVVG